VAVRTLGVWFWAELLAAHLEAEHRPQFQGIRPHPGYDCWRFWLCGWWPGSRFRPRWMMAPRDGNSATKRGALARKSERYWFGFIVVTFAALLSYSVGAVFDVSAFTELVLFCGIGVLLSGLVKILRRIASSSADVGVDADAPR